eukprot:1387260-Prorocentrum_lima.AAC.1
MEAGRLLGGTLNKVQYDPVVWSPVQDYITEWQQQAKPGIKLTIRGLRKEVWMLRASAEPGPS